MWIYGAQETVYKIGTRISSREWTLFRWILDAGTCMAVDILRMIHKGAVHGDAVSFPPLSWQLILVIVVYVSTVQMN